MDITEKLHEHDVKIENLLFYQGDELHHDEIEDLIGTYDNEDLSKILGKDLEDMDDDSIYDLFDEEYIGHFFAEVHTPVKKPFGKRGALSWSWGTTTFTLVIAKTFEELVEKSCKWAKEKEEEFRKGFSEEKSDGEV